MGTSTVPYGRSTQKAPAVKEVHILWITAGLGCDGDRVAVTRKTRCHPDNVDIRDWRFLLSYATVRDCVSGHGDFLLFGWTSMNRVVGAPALETTYIRRVTIVTSRRVLICA